MSVKKVQAISYSILRLYNFWKILSRMVSVEYIITVPLPVSSTRL